MAYVSESVGANGISVPNLGESLSKGAASAAALEQAKLHNNELKQHIDQQKEAYQSGVADKVMDLMGQAARAPNPASRNFMINQARMLGSKHGMPVGEWADYASKADMLPEIMAKLQPMFDNIKQNPSLAPQGRALLAQAMGSSDMGSADKPMADFIGLDKQATTLQAAQIKNTVAQQRLGISQDRLNQNIHKDIINKMKGDKSATALSDAMNAVQNGLQELHSSKDKNSATVHDVQNRINLAITGALRTTGNEREARTIQRYRDDFNKEMEKLGNLNTYSEDDPLIQHLDNLGSLYLKNNRVVLADKIKAQGSGQETFYGNNPELAKDKENVANGILDVAGSLSARKIKSNPGLVDEIRKARANGMSVEDVNNELIKHHPRNNFFSPLHQDEYDRLSGNAPQPASIAQRPSMPNQSPQANPGGVPSYTAGTTGEGPFTNPDDYEPTVTNSSSDEGDEE